MALSLVISQVPITFSDLEYVDMELYHHLRWLKKLPTGSEVAVSSLMLDFTVSYPGKNS